MTYFNPLTGAAIPGGQAQEQLAAAKARQVRRAQTLARNVAAEGDTFEHQVESTEQLLAIHDEQSQEQSHPRHQSRNQSRPSDGDSHPRLDLKA